MGTINREVLKLMFTVVFFAVCVYATPAHADYVRKFKMFDISQYADPSWGDNWCAPTAVGNSFAWLAKEYNLVGLSKVNGTGAALSAKDIINILGKVDMGTVPNGLNAGTQRTNILPGKLSYIDRHGLKNLIRVESQVAVPTLADDGSFTGYTGKPVTKKWLEDQYKKGQDVEFSVSYYEIVGGKRIRKGGHAIVKDGQVPGEEAGGHVLSMSGFSDPLGSDIDADFYISFTDPGRNDLAGQFGAVASDQYPLQDLLGNTYLNTESTYKMVYDPNAMGVGIGAYLLDGYQGAGDFVSDGINRRFLTVVEAGWAESPIPEPATMTLLGAGLGLGGLLRSRRSRAVPNKSK